MLILYHNAGMMQEGGREHVWRWCLASRCDEQPVCVCSGLLGRWAGERGFISLPGPFVFSFCVDRSGRWEFVRVSTCDSRMRERESERRLLFDQAASKSLTG